MWPCVTGFFHSVRYVQDSSTLQRGSKYHSSLLLDTIPLRGCATFHLSILQLLENGIMGNTGMNMWAQACVDMFGFSGIYI